MFESVHIASPASAPPGRTCRTPSGKPASSKMRASTKPPDSTVRGSGFRTTALPRARAGATARAERMSGKLNGEITPNHAARYAPRHADAARIARQNEALWLGDHRCSAMNDVGDRVNFETGLWRDTACLTHDPIGELFLMFFQQRRGFAHDRSALFIRRRGPSGLCLLGFRSREPHVLGCRIADACEDGARRGLKHIKHVAFGLLPARGEDASIPCGLDHELWMRCIHRDLPEKGCLLEPSVIRLA